MCVDFTWLLSWIILLSAATSRIPFLSGCESACNRSFISTFLWWKKKNESASFWCRHFHSRCTTHLFFFFCIDWENALCHSHLSFKCSRRPLTVCSRRFTLLSSLKIIRSYSHLCSKPKKKSTLVFDVMTQYEPFSRWDDAGCTLWNPEGVQHMQQRLLIICSFAASMWHFQFVWWQQEEP